MKVYILVFHDYEGDDFGPILATRELAEKVREHASHYEVEEYEVLDTMPLRVTMHYAQRYARSMDEVRTGSRVFWDYELADLPRTMFIAWGHTVEEAVAALLPQ